VQMGRAARRGHDLRWRLTLPRRCSAGNRMGCCIQGASAAAALILRCAVGCCAALCAVVEGAVRVGFCTCWRLRRGDWLGRGQRLNRLRRWVGVGGWQQSSWAQRFGRAQRRCRSGWFGAGGALRQGGACSGRGGCAGPGGWGCLSGGCCRARAGRLGAQFNHHLYGFRRGSGGRCPAAVQRPQHPGVRQHHGGGHADGACKGAPRQTGQGHGGWEQAGSKKVARWCAGQAEQHSKL